MEALSKVLAGWREFASSQLETALGLLPGLLAALALLVLGFIIAYLLRIILRRFGHGINEVLERIFGQGALAGLHVSAGALRVAETVIYWLVLVYFVASAANVAGLSAFAAWLDQVVALVPSIAGGGLIIVVGFAISTLVRDLVSSSMTSAQISDSQLPALLAQGATFLIAFVIGIEQIGVDVTFITSLLSIALAGALLSFALAFGLGARSLVSNLIGAHDLRQHYALGQQLRIGDVDGRILELTATSIVLETELGRVVVPAKVFHEQTTTLVVPSQ